MSARLQLIRADHLVPWPGLNPRRHFNALKHAELVASIRRDGVHQPLLVHDPGGVAPFWVVAGERRLRAASEIGPDTLVPCLVREYSEAEALKVALIENMDRDDLSPIEEARGFQRLLDQPGMTQRKLAEEIGRTQPSISNRIRLLELPEAILALVEEGRLEVSHARDLLLPFAKIPEPKRTKLFADVAKTLRKRSDSTDELTVRRLVADTARKLSRALTHPDYGEKHAPRFDPKLHAGTKKTPGCSCQGPRFEYSWQKSVRCFDEAWWDAAQAAAIEAEKQAEARAAAKLAEQDAGTVRVMKDADFRRAHESSRNKPSIESASTPVDAKLLASAAMVVVERYGRHDVICVDEAAYRKAKSAATKVRNQMLAEKKAERTAKLVQQLATAKLEPWMLVEILAERPYDDLVVEVARELGLEMAKPKKDAWNWVDRALRKLPPTDAERLFIALALRSKAKELGDDKLTGQVDAAVRRKFGPGAAALRKRALEAAGIDPAKAPEEPEDLDDDTEDGDAADIECVVCGMPDFLVEPGVPWLVVDAASKRGVCEDCAVSKEEAEQLLAEKAA